MHVNKYQDTFSVSPAHNISNLLAKHAFAACCEHQSIKRILAHPPEELKAGLSIESPFSKLMIQYLRHHQIDKQKWDACVETSKEGVVFVLS